ncbi:uncharacterized protein LOC101861429 [Aplysia californica]|uniref:Uncharacterized protein LOC101861429 n=1 Tax=Aplysia californica TaxID=6500 RepID=A0ABM0JI79_APLCA|nr:uncharacterized protein LOC101861429 [Aplysia californica]
MGMSLSFRDSVREAMDVHRRSRDRCQSPACETKLWKANHELKQARTEIGQLQEQLAQMSIQNPNVAVWRYDPETVDVIESQADEMAEWEGQAEASGSQSEEDAVRVTLL